MKPENDSGAGEGLRMIGYDAAQEILSQHVRRLGSEQAAIEGACGRILAQAVYADRPIPPADLSAMDGYACRRADVGGPLTIIETIPAGKRPAKVIGPGQCARIMTGAPVPDGADTVVLVEHTECTGDTVRVTRAVSKKSNIRYRGEELAEGDEVLPAGTHIGPVEVAVLASVGCDPVTVSVRPRVGVIATGDELVEPSCAPGRAQIRNSNSYQLCAQIARAGALPAYFGIAPDRPADTEALARTALAESDVVLLSGGVSMGEYDFVPEVLKAIGAQLLFDKVAVQPGKPTVFGVFDEKRLFGMPGNPVSTFVLFELMVRPFLNAMMGAAYKPRELLCTLAEPMRRKKTDRLSFRPVRVDRDGVAHPLHYHGSGHIHAYRQANGITAFPLGAAELAAGETVNVVLI